MTNFTKIVKTSPVNVTMTIVPAFILCLHYLYSQFVLCNSPGTTTTPFCTFFCQATTLDKLETFDEVDRYIPEMYTSDSKFGNLVSNDIEIVEEPTRTLHHDIYVNKLMADAGAPFNPDAEVLDIVDGRPVLLNSKVERLCASQGCDQKIVSKDSHSGRVSNAEAFSSASLGASSQNANEFTENIRTETQKPYTKEYLNPTPVSGVETTITTDESLSTSNAIIAY